MKAISDPRYLEMIALLRAAREAHGVTQTRLAEMIGKPQSFIAKVETCERRIDLIETMTICSTLGISLKVLIPSELRETLLGRSRRVQRGRRRE